jgi:hypothetical protein
MSGGQTTFALAVVVVLLAIALIRPGLVALLGLPLALVLIVVTVRIRGEALGAWTGRHLHWVVARARGWTAYRAAETALLPGVLGDIALVDESPGFVWDHRASTLTAVVPVEPLGVGLVSAEQVQEWVDAWSDWLAHLGYVPDIKHVVVTVHTGPSPPGVAAPDSGGAGTTVVHDVVGELRDQANVAGSGRMSHTVVSITIRVPRSEGTAAAGDRLLELLATVGPSLARCGLNALAAMTAQELIRWIREVFDPGAQPVAGDALSDARPTAAEEHWDHYQHDGAFSAAYVWDEAPGESMAPAVLARLLGPSDYHKRICLVYEPIPAHAAVREVDRQAQAAAFRSQYRRRLGRDETARERVDLERARQTATDQVTGSGLVDVGVYAVVSSPTLEGLSACTADLENRAGESRIRLRRNYGAQAATFACTVGVGFVPRRATAT